MKKIVPCLKPNGANDADAKERAENFGGVFDFPYKLSQLTPKAS